MFLCEDCSLVFDEPNDRKEANPVGYEIHYRTCPGCGSEEFVQGYLCPECHEFVEGYESRNPACCEECGKKAESEIMKFINTFYSKSVREYLWETDHFSYTLKDLELLD